MSTDDTEMNNWFSNKSAAQARQDRNQEKIKVDLLWNDVSWMTWFLKRYNVDLDAVCRETCRRVNGRLRR